MNEKQGQTCIKKEKNTTDQSRIIIQKQRKTAQHIATKHFEAAIIMIKYITIDTRSAE